MASGEHRGCGGVGGIGAIGVYRVHWRWQVDWEPSHIGPWSRVPALPLVPLWEWPTSPRPGKGPVQGPITPTGFPWEATYLAQAKQVTEMSSAGYYIHFKLYFSGSLHICICAASSHILTCNVKKCYMDYVLSRPIYTYPNAINLTYYDTMVLITKNYFSHQTCKLGTSDCKCQADQM